MSIPKSKIGKIVLALFLSLFLSMLGMQIVISGVVLLFACVKFNPGNFVNENFSFICYIISCIFIFTGTMWYMNDSEKG